MRINSVIGILIILIAGCTKALELPDTAPDTSILVVEGDIRTGAQTENKIRLSRLKPLFQFEDIPELRAKVEIVSQSGTKWALTDNNNGDYTSVLQLPDNVPLALRIQTTDGKIYESPFQNSIATPAIDSVTWRQEPGGVRVFVHSKDPGNKTKYYRWTYTETWERKAWYNSLYDFKNGEIVERPDSEQVYTCWKSEDEQRIIVNNTEELGQDLISYQPVSFIPNLSEKLYVRYSILVRQLGLSKEAYDYWQILKKNTELTGSIFDAQPSQMPTNITCTNDKLRSVVGYISVGKISEKRLFVLHSALNLWPIRNEEQGCEAFEYPRFFAERFLRQNTNYLPAYFVTAGGGFGVAPKSCVDCRLTGGNTVKPDFW